MAIIVYRLTFLAALVFAHETFQEEKHLHTPAPSEPSNSVDGIETGEVTPFEYSAGTDHAFEPRRRRPDKGWGAFAPALLAASSILPILLTGLAALAGKALMSSVLALAIAGYNLFRANQPPPNGF